MRRRSAHHREGNRERVRTEGRWYDIRRHELDLHRPAGRDVELVRGREAVRWRRVDLQQIVAERFGVAYHERTIGKILKQLGFSHVSARPRHPAKDEETVAAFKKTSPRR